MKHHKLSPPPPLMATLKRPFLTPSILFLLISVLIISTTSFIFSYLFFPHFPSPATTTGCHPDSEGSWSIGVFFGDDPFHLRPIEDENIWRNGSKAWPVANPVFTCAGASEGGVLSNFVADPFLHVQGDTYYLFFETKNSITLQGDIGVAVSKDQGATWKHLGTALDEEWHLSYPYVFSYEDQIYMLPESSKKGELRLYRAVDFPLKWKFEKVILKKPLIDSVIINYEGRFWLFGSDFSEFGAKKNGELEIWSSSSPLGPWVPHKQNPVHNADKSLGARNAGRVFIYNGNLYRPGQDCGETYGRRVRMFRVTTLTTNTYEEVEVPLGIEESKKGRNAWNGARYHHLDVHQLPSGKWIAVMDGDRVPSGDFSRRLAVGYASFAVAIGLVILSGVLISAIKCIIPLGWYLPISAKRNDVVHKQEHFYLYSNLSWVFAYINRLAFPLQGRLKPNTCAGRLVLCFMFVLVVGLTCTGTYYSFGGNGAEEPYPVEGHYSQYTLVTMTYDARLWNLKMFVKHYSRCSSVREIVIVWNKGTPPTVNDFDSVVPVRIRVEKKNSLNNRFNADPLIKTRSVLELDDDIMMTCDDVERGFKVWRDHPDRIVGFYPRLAGRRLRYRDEKFARRRNGYNMILTGAAFIDAELAFKRYWSEEAAQGREIVEKFFNCEDVLLNFLYVNASSSKKTVEYVKPSWAVDTSKFSGVGISTNSCHYQVRSRCLHKFTKLYGNLAANRWEFDSRNDGWDV